MNTRSQHGARPRRTSGLTTVVFFGLLIGIVLVGSQLVAMWWWPVRHFDGYAGVLGALFLAAGLIVGLRGRVTGRTSSPNRAPPAGSATIHVPETSPPELVEPLTPRELEILTSLAEGWSNAEIAERHVVSVNTVKTHLRQIYGKLQVTRRVQALSRARQMGLLR